MERIVRMRYGVKMETGADHSMAMKYLQQFKKLIVQAVSEGYITVDPFYSYPILIAEIHNKTEQQGMNQKQAAEALGIDYTKIILCD